MICLWAGHQDDPPAEYMIVLERPCGHAPNKGQRLAPSCLVCTVRKRAQPVAGRATVCDRCGQTNRPALVAVTSL